jgi:hypothetical protein
MLITLVSCRCLLHFISGINVPFSQASKLVLVSSRDCFVNGYKQARSNAIVSSTGHDYMNILFVVTQIVTELAISIAQFALLIKLETFMLINSRGGNINKYSKTLCNFSYISFLFFHLFFFLCFFFCLSRIYFFCFSFFFQVLHVFFLFFFQDCFFLFYFYIFFQNYLCRFFFILNWLKI